MSAALFDVDQFAVSMEQRFDSDRIESIWDCQEIFEQLVAGAAATQALNAELQRLVDDVSYVGDWRPQHLILRRGRGYILSVAQFSENQRYIHTAPFYGFYAPLGHQPLHYQTYTLPDDYRNEVFDPRIRITAGERHQVDAGSALALQTDRRIYDFIVTRPQLVLKLTTAAYHTLEWLFTRDSLSAWQANDADLRATQLRVGAYLLGRLADESSLTPLRQLGSHPNHSARWAAIQAIGRLSRAEGLAQLEKAVSDPHPHIRNAAQKALTAFKTTGY